MLLSFFLKLKLYGSTTKTINIDLHPKQKALTKIVKALSIGRN